MNEPAFTSQIRPTSGCFCSSLLSQSILLAFVHPPSATATTATETITKRGVIARCYTLRAFLPSFAAKRAFGRGHRQAGVDDQRLPRDPARLVAGQIDGAPAHVPAGALGAERARAPAPLAGGVAEVLHHGRPDGSGRDRVDAESLGPELDCYRADESDHARLRRRIRGAAVAAEPRDRRDADDRTAAAPDHRRCGGLRREEHRLEVDRDHAIPLFLG